MNARKFFLAFLIGLLCCTPSISYAQDATSDDFENYINFEDEGEDLNISDPFYNVNKITFKFNDTLINYVFDPFSRGYEFIVRKPIQKSLDNFFNNISMPRNVLNNLLQQKGQRAGIVMGRFLINTSIGIGGLFDPAKYYFDLERYDEDFGQTLGYYNIGEGPYIVLPLLGPSNARDTVGVIADIAMNPLFWLNIYDVYPEDAFKAMAYTQQVNNFTYNVRDDYDKVVGDAFDPYVALQHAYYQNRRKKIAE